MANLRFSSEEIRAAIDCLGRGASIGFGLSDPPAQPCCNTYIGRLHRPLEELNKEEDHVRSNISDARQNLRTTIEIFEATEAQISQSLSSLQKS
ncbi:hypothetical protein I6H42_01615 [Schaalia meyeri]|uniref:Uncharacterized protein n=1 Tax=Schaalia meyeri TaxID=52773 RepID=A0AAP9Y7C3_9ACTO|nr:hypothetical protein [Schaalia meyeri]QQC44147.1 hypothetical protein I6H42_01615 [Schaalia meyeri]SDR68353.1 hypothetical protein SAMN04489715_0749 [Schaalia meyeri]